MSVCADQDPPRPAPGRPKDLTKRAAILDAAKQMFTRQGFDGASMDQIAALAGVSKLTIYSHFGDKDALFVAVVNAACEQQLPTALFEPSPETPLRERLMDIARAYHALVMAPETVASHRMLCAPRLDSTLACNFWNAGPARLHDAFAALVARRQAAGDLDVADPARAAGHFFSLVKGEAFARLVIGYPDTAAESGVDAHLESCVDMFLRAFARAGRAP
ncbi:TetR/AcrR family transcriptional regulator [Luteimonas sp. MC1572]|uniref:TetR/AcrR family transcriptional regulator n=1 Tax=Luteimonas sp. MC1572 TaxID=2799325 RepID=UPI0018F0DDE5|nr:TetR/AcrR family transcriptional regulator [Luteimonas sp. MC1572]MBJ6981513.1 TetR/AcrR family transcriptional regulator [Luteimonas sp. MC1572]QQO02814.1 TetR/AcrR family transcriptional regulator [Luteimonas sp. MC1572]